jgi:hypothetical protein
MNALKIGVSSKASKNEWVSLHLCDNGVCSINWVRLLAKRAKFVNKIAGPKGLTWVQNSLPSQLTQHVYDECYG